MELWTMIRRMSASGAKNFTRSGLVSVATVLIMTVTLSIITFLIFLLALLSFTLTRLEHKVDVNVYFVTTAPESDILILKDHLEKLPEVASVAYVPRDEVLSSFRQYHENDELTLQALDELGANPFGASLSIVAKDPSQYESIVSFLSKDSALSTGGTSIIDRNNYKQNKTTIENITSAIDATEKAGLVVVLLFALASVIIAFATIRLAIYTARDEIGVMRLVGASNGYIRGPFVIEGIITGALSSLLVLILFYPMTWYASTTTIWLGGFDFFAYYREHFPFIFLVVAGSGIFLGGFASFLAVRKYLKI